MMDKQKLEYFRELLLDESRQAIENQQADRSTALQGGKRRRGYRRHVRVGPKPLNGPRPGRSGDPPYRRYR